MTEPRPRHYNLADIPQGSFVEEGLTRIHTAWIDDYIVKEHGEAARDAAWRSLIPQWLTLLGSELTGGYRLDESENFTILQPADTKDPHRLPDHAEKSRDLVAQYWAGLSTDDGVGKHVIIAAASQEEYYQYTCVFDRDGSHGGSGGKCIRSTGYTHIALNKSSVIDRDLAATHEIAHCMIGHLPLPLWLEEGMVMLAEEYINRTGPGLPDIAEHRAYWAEHTFAGFWLGSAFRESDGGQKLAYELARHVVYSLASKNKPKFLAFASNANWDDAGKTAAEAHLSHSLARCLPEFLQIGFEPPR